MNEAWEAVASNVAEIFVVTCGYEERSSYVHQHFKGEISALIVLDYNCPDILHYDKNKSYFSSISNALFVDLTSASAAEEFERTFLECISNSESESPAIFFDISSCSRSVIANSFLSISRKAPPSSTLTCCYALSAFDKAPDGELPSSVSEPVVGDLSGWSDDLSKPPCAIIALGFEPGRALGSIDYLEVPEVRLFMPEGPDTRFKDAVYKANSMLIEEAGSGAVLPYDVLDPQATYEKLDSLLFGLLAQFRPVIIPLGPKIFAALSIIIAIRMWPNVCVWRTSAGSGEDVTNRSAQGEIAVFITAVPQAPVANLNEEVCTN